MKVIIDIPNELAEKGHWYTDEEMWTVIKAAQNGTPIPDNATVCDIYAIRAEIENIKDFEVVNGGLYVRQYDVMEIIDKYTKGD